jgi:hypothetical protein
MNMTDDIISLSEARADKTGDARDWTAEDALRACLRDIQSGKIKPSMIHIAIREMHDDGTVSYPSYLAGMTSFETLALLMAHVKRL